MSIYSRKNKKKRILFVGFAYIVSIYQSKLKAIFDTGEIEVAWLSPIQWKMHSWNRVIPLEIRYKDIQVYPAKVWFFNGVNGGYIYPILSFVKVIKSFKPDVLHYEQEVFSLSAFQAAIFARIFKIPLIVFCWENIQKHLPIYRQWTTNFVLDTADAIVAGSTGAAQLLRTWGYEKKILIMPQIGVDTNLFFPRPQMDSKKVFNVGFIGRLVPEKGVDLLLDAAKYLIETGVNMHIVICGSGTHETNLRRYADEMNLKQQISWLSFVRHDHIPDVMAKLDVVVLPSRTVPGVWMEQFGHALVEAMAMGVPVIGSDSGAIPEVIGRRDLIFPEDDFLELAKILKRLFVDTEWKTEVSEFLRDRVLEEYSDQIIASKLISMWTEVLTKKVNSLDTFMMK